MKYCLWLLLALTAPCAFGATAGGTPQGHSARPPARWAKYSEAMHDAEEIVGDEVRCKAYQDIPGNHWLPGTAQARCSMLRKPALSLAEIDDLLVLPDGAQTIARTFSSLLAANYQDPA